MKKRYILRAAALVLFASIVFSCVCACGKNEEQIEKQQEETETLGNSAVSNVEEENGVKLHIRTSSDYYIDGEQLIMTAVLSNNTNGYIPVCAPRGSGGREGALIVNAAADGYQLRCLQNDWGKTMPVSMSDVDAPYYFLVEPGQSVSCTYVFDSCVELDGAVYPLWQTMVAATLNVKVGEQLPKRQGGLDKLSYENRTVSVNITFDGTADRP